MSNDPQVLASMWISSQEIEGERSEADWIPIFAVQDLESDPERLWEFVLVAEARARDPKVRNVLGAGPLEDLVNEHGAEFIDRIELRAAQSRTFAELLSHVWVRGNEDTVRQRYISLGCAVVRNPAMSARPEQQA